MPFKQKFRSVMEWLRHVVTEPRSELTRWQRAVRFAYDLGRFGARQLRQDNAPQMADRSQRGGLAPLRPLEFACLSV